MKTSVLLKRLGVAILLAASFVPSAALAESSYATSSSPQTVSSDGKTLGQSFGTYTVGSKSTSIKGKVRDRADNGNRVYPRINKTVSARNSTTVHTTGMRTTSTSWVAYPRFSTGYASKTSISKISVSTCEDIRNWFDPCSGEKVIYRR